jgi:hypothetical protein
MAALFIHFILLAWLSFASARRIVAGRADAVIAACLLMWANIVATSLLLSVLGEMGQATWFFRSSLVLALSLFAVLRRLKLSADAPDPRANDNSPKNRWLITLVAISVGLFGAASLWICIAYTPNNYDSLTYHLPRVIYYLGQGSLAHFDTGNPRQTYFPYNYNLLQLFALVYDADLKAVALVNLLAWMFSGIVLFRLSRRCGCSFNASLMATWIALTSTQILAQASATTNDLPTGAAILAAIFFGKIWLDSGKKRHAILAAIAAGLAIGSKLTFVFFGPAGVVLLVIGVWRFIQVRGTKALPDLVRPWIFPAILIGLLGLPWVVVNILTTGEWMTKTYDFTLNQPISLACAWQTAQAYTTQLFIEPLHRFTFDLEITARLNEWATASLFPHWNNAHAFSSFFVFPPDLNEDHVWFGFAGPLLLLSAVAVLVRDWRCRSAVSWLALLGIGWFLTYFLLNKWSLYIQRYFVPPLLVLGPCLAASIDRWGNYSTIRQWAHRIVFSLVIGTSLWFGGHYLVFNTSRPLAPLLAGNPAKLTLPLLPLDLVDKLENNNRFNIDSYGGNERIMLLMMIPKLAKFTASESLIPDSYNIMSHWGFVRRNLYSNIASFSSYTSLEYPQKPTAGVEFLGTFGHGVQAWDYWGIKPNPNESQASKKDSNLLLAMRYAAKEPDRYAASTLKLTGLNPSDHAELDVFVDRESGGQQLLATFTKSSTRDVSIEGPFTGLALRLRPAGTNQIIAETRLPYGNLASQPDQKIEPSEHAIFVSDCIEPGKRAPLKVTGLSALEGPYDQWELPQFRWNKTPVLRLEIPPLADLKRIRVAMSFRLQMRNEAALEIYHNGKFIRRISMSGKTNWFSESLELMAQEGPNKIEIRDAPPFEEPNWLAYYELHKDLILATAVDESSLEDLAQKHYESVGQQANLELPLKFSAEQPGPPSEDLYLIYRTLRIEGIAL